jgi:outer membrane immunogenic protein
MPSCWITTFLIQSRYDLFTTIDVAGDANRGVSMRTRCVVLFVAAGLSLVLAQSASAADLSLPPPSSSSPPPSFFSWTGWYVGVNGGGGWGTTSHAASVGISGIPGIPALSTGNFNTGGGIAGGTLGYNYQFGHFLAGIETDLDWSNIRGTFNGTVPAVSGGTFSLSSQLQWLDTTRGRVGVVWDHALFYGTAGAAFGGLNATAKASAAVSGVGAPSPPVIRKPDSAGPPVAASNTPLTTLSAARSNTCMSVWDRKIRS